MTPAQFWGHVAEIKGWNFAFGGIVRGPVTPGNDFIGTCPIVSVYHKITGLSVRNCHAKEIGRDMGLMPAFVDAVYYAADYMHEHELKFHSRFAVAMRRKLLQVTNLTGGVA